MIEAELFFAFLRVGSFAFGGAYSAIPLIRDVVMAHGWLSDEALSYMIAVSESTPGPIMINLATYVGSSQAGFAGAFLATFAVVLPSFLVILLVMALLRNFMRNSYVQALLRGLKPCIVGIVMAVGCSMALSACVRVESSFTVRSESLFLFSLLAALLWGHSCLGLKKIAPVKLIVLSAVLGVAVYSF